MMTLTALDFILPEWQEHDFKLMRKASDKVVAIASNAGKRSDSFKNACRELLEISLSGDNARLKKAISQPIDVRAFTFLLYSSDEFSKSVAVSRACLDALLVPRSPMSKLSLVQLVRAFFVRFDTVSSSEGIREWCDFIKRNLNDLALDTGSSDLSRYAKYSSILFSLDGPRNVVDYAKEHQIDLGVLFERFGLDGFTGARYVQLCHYQYYLETLKNITVGSDNKILSEVVKKEVINAPYSDNKQLGHVILEILIDRSAGQSISTSWQRAVLTIAGDPRVPSSSRNYQQWWELLGEKRIALMRGWLSRFDLKLFLKVLEQSARDGSNSDMERMFESRKVFMEGLLKQGLVGESRLFLSSYAEHYLKKHYKKEELPEYARVASQQTSMIYLNVSGKVHVIEGSHSFKLKLFDRLPVASRVLDYNVKNYADTDLRSSIVFKYNKEYRNPKGMRELTHDIHLGWQNKAIEFIRAQGLSVDVAEMISNSRYREYKNKFGAN